MSAGGEPYTPIPLLTGREPLRAHDSMLFLAALLEDQGLPRDAAIATAARAHAAGEHDHDGGFASQRASLEADEVRYLRQSENAIDYAAAIRRVVADRYAPRTDSEEIPW